LKEKIFVIDGHALCYRAYYAMIRNPLINSKGMNTSAIFGFARMLFRLIYDQKPDYLLVAFDPPVKSFRFNLYSEYKANRQKMPDDLKWQIDEIKNLVDIMGIIRLEDNNFEADDLLGSIAKQFGKGNKEVILVTGDKDAYQLVNDNVKIYANKKGISEFEFYDRDAIIEKLGFTPEQVIDYMALMGDTSDNIPGVKGVGEKSAKKLIQTYSNLDTIYEKIEEIKGKMQEYLIRDKEQAYLSKELVTIATDVEINIALETISTENIFSENLRKYFHELEMDSIIKEYFKDSTSTTKSITTEYEIIKTEKELDEIIKDIYELGLISVDTETTSTKPMDAELVGISISYEEGKGFYFPIVEATLFSEKYLSPEISLNKLKPMLEDEGIKKIGQNIKYDYIVLKNAGVEMQGIYFDTMIASYLINPVERRHNLDDLAEKYLNHKTITYKELVGTGKKSIKITEVPLTTLANYAIEDADITFRLFKIFEKQLKEKNLNNLFYNIEMKVLETLAQMEINGVKIDEKHFQHLAIENDKLLLETEENIYKEAKQKFNINSTKELAVILFENLGLKPVKKTKTGFSTDITVLEALKGEHPIIEELIRYRTINKLKNTYIDTLPKLINPQTKRIHTSYNQTVAITGRLSSSSPNLQNIPVKDNFRKQIRQGFIAEKNFFLISADYSQIELRIAAYLSKDKNMLKAFTENIDIHSLTASNIFEIPIEQITGEMRRKAKVINFATIYGVSPYGLSQQAEISVKEAATFIEKYFETYPGFKKYMEDTINLAKEQGFVETLLGRKREIPEINSENRFRREGAERTAINTPIQGTSADLIKVAMNKIQTEFNKKNLKSKIIIQVHDELVFEVFENEKKNVEEIIIKNMGNPIDINLNLIVDLGYGKNWGEAH